MKASSNDWACAEVRTEIRGRVGFITLARPKALNALSLPMIRALTATLLHWRGDPAVVAVAIRGSSRDAADPARGAPFGAFCAGGDIRFFHQAALAGDPALEDFFTEEYALNHLIHGYGKPYLAFMDGIVMGGGMGISQGASRRIVTARTKMAMPETNIGLFPDVGGGWFLARCPGRVGEYLALTGAVIGADDALRWGLADALLPVERLQAAWDGLADAALADANAVHAWIDRETTADVPAPADDLASRIDLHFARDDVQAIVDSLESSDQSWEVATAAALRQRSPLMLHVTLEQVRRARAGLGLADALRMERDLVRHCFHLRPGAASETVEGIRALAVDKDHAPRWNPARIEDVTPDRVAPFFTSPWPAHAHPLRDLGVLAG